MYWYNCNQSERKIYNWFDNTRILILSNLILMACLHKFHDYLNLSKGYINPQLDYLDFQPATLLVGTFNPSWPDGNIAEWFYGRLRNNYTWDVLPRLFNHQHNLRIKPHNNHNEWKSFCANNGVALTDIISCINDADPNNEEHQDVLRTYLDSSIADYFEDFTFTDIIGILDKFPSIQNVYLSRQDGIALFDEQWKFIEQYSIEHPERKMHIIKLLTPSASARFQIREYKQAHPNDRTPLRNFIYSSWLQQWHV